MYPPEINAGRYDAGVGPALWVAAAAEWGLMAAMVTEAIAALGLQVGSITGQWEGAASQRFGAATTPYAAWLTEMAGIATLNAQRSLGVVEAYAAGRAAMVPLPVIIANRVAARTAQVIGALGAPNTEMVRLEIEYAAFWSHNATVMTGYDTAVTAATAPTPVNPPPPLVVDAVPGGSMPGNLQQLAQQLGQGGNPMTRTFPSGFMSKYAGPSLGNSSTLARMFGSGSGTGGAFGGRGGGAGAGSGAGGGFGGVASLLSAPLASFSPANAGASIGQSGPAFGGVQNTPSAARPAVPMTPPMGRGSRLQQELDERERESIVAANQEFVAAPALSDAGHRSGEGEISAPSQLR
jgi:PPE family